MARTTEMTIRKAKAEMLLERANERKSWLVLTWKGNQLWFKKKAIVGVTPHFEDTAFTDIWVWGADDPFVTDESVSAVLEKLGLGLPAGKEAEEAGP